MAWLRTGSDQASSPLASSREMRNAVPAGIVTFQVIDVLVWSPRSKLVSVNGVF
jgi:hypothetical protein